jgi:hypothetical protein
MLDQDLSRMGGHIKHALFRPFLQHPPSKLYPITLRHHDVNQEQVHSATGLTQHVQSFDARVSFQHSVAFLAQRAVSHTARHSLIIDNENGRGRMGERDSQLSSRPRDVCEYRLQTGIGV